MKTRFDPPWALAEQLWLFGKASEVIVKCIDSKVLRGSTAAHDCCVESLDQRLNPLEFHGRRCCDASR
jgi:hypothetical protein